MSNYLVTDTDMTSVADAIRTKGGTSASLAFPTGFVNAINDIPSGGGSGPVAEKDVNFIDYDGTLLYSYTASEFANLSALPANPSHDGLVAQGWNWTLANAKTYVASYGKLWIGQMYITSSGDTEIDIDLHAPRLSPYLGIAVNGSVEVDWGDGTAKSTVTGSSLTTQVNTAHVYASEGKYTIKIHVASGSFAPYASGGMKSIINGNMSDNSNRVYSGSVIAVRIGSGISTIGACAFNYCYSLTTITIPSNITNIGNSSFESCLSLIAITIPSSITTIGSSSTFDKCYSLRLVSLPIGTSNVPPFINCFSLHSATIPSGVTSVGSKCFYYCYALESVTIPNTVTSLGDNSFANCQSLRSINIPNSVTSFGTSLFANNYSLGAVTIPSGVAKINNSDFASCYSLASMTIPSGVTTINSLSLQYLYGMKEIHFKRTTPPTLANSTIFAGLPTDCIIYVPTGKLSTYTSASNYPSSSTYTYMEE